MTEKRKTIKDYNIPANFRLTIENKNKMVKAVVRRKFFKQANDLYNEEVEICNCINEYFNNRELRYQFELIAEGFGGIQNIKHSLFSERSNSSLIRDKGNCIDIGYKYSLSVSGNFKSGLCGTLAGVAESNKDVHRGNFYFFLPSFFNDNVILSSLPRVLQKRIAALIEKVATVNKKIALLTEKTRMVINSYTSVLALLEIAPEFEAIIRLAVDLDEIPRCSDIPTADSVQELRKLL